MWSITTTCTGIRAVLTERPLSVYGGGVGFMVHCVGVSCARVAIPGAGADVAQDVFVVVLVVGCVASADRLVVFAFACVFGGGFDSVIVLLVDGGTLGPGAHSLPRKGVLVAWSIASKSLPSIRPSLAVMIWVVWYNRPCY